MAILSRGRTRCPICGKVIEEGEEAELFPHLISNEQDLRYPLSDAACHPACVNASTVGIQMRLAASEYLKNTGPGNRVCSVCSNQVLESDNYLLIGYLAEPATDLLGKFNYTHLHKSHIRDWEGAIEFLALAKAALREGRWKGEALSKIIQQIEDGMLPIRTAR